MTKELEREFQLVNKTSSDVELKVNQELIFRTEFQVEVGWSLGRPQAHGVDSVVSVAWNRAVIWHSIDDLSVNPLGNIVLLDGTTIEVNRDHVLWARLLPWVSVSEPIIRLLNL